MQKPKIYIKFVDFWPGFNPNDNFLLNLLSESYTPIISNKPEFIIYSCFGYEFLNYDCIRVFYTGENIQPNFKECDYALSFYHNSHQHLSDCCNYHGKQRSFYLPLYALNIGSITKKQINSQRDFCSFLYSNKDCKIRNHFYHRLSQYKTISSGGSVFNNTGHKIAPKDTIDYLSQHKFSITFENSEGFGYTTEKLTRALMANTVPIYWGNPLVEKDFNPKAFINAYDFGDFDALANYVIKVDNDDTLYLRYLNQPMFAKNNAFVNRDKMVLMLKTIFSDKNTHYTTKGNKLYRQLLRYADKKLTKIQRFLQQQ